MKTFAFVFLSLAAGCATDGDDDRPIVTQPGQPPVSGGGGAARVTGRVCVAEDLRNLSACSSGRAGGFAVAVGSKAAVTEPDGSFTVDAPSTEDAMFTVSGTSTSGLTIVPTTSPFAPSAVVPAIDAELYQSILLANGISVVDGTGTVVATVTRDGLAASGVTVTSNPTGSAGPFYGGSSSTLWGTTGTGDTGTLMIPGVTAGTVDLSYQTVLGGLETQVNGVTVRNGGVTVLDTNLSGNGTP